jgi:hypothetical protein
MFLKHRRNQSDTNLEEFRGKMGKLFNLNKLQIDPDNLVIN